MPLVYPSCQLPGKFSIPVKRDVARVGKYTSSNVLT
jgi:hypothetical protein